MASFSKRGTKWRIRWREAGQQRQKTVASLRDARRICGEIQRCEDRGERWVDPATLGDPPLIEALQAWLDVSGMTITDGTYRSRSTACNVLLAYLEHAGHPSPRLSVLSSTMLTRWWRWMQDNGRAQSTANQRVRVVLQAWRWLYESEAWEDITPRPRAVQLPRVAYSENAAPTWAEMDACVGAARYEWHRRLLVLLRFTGLRVSQASRLLWSDFDLEAGSLRVRGELGKSHRERAGRTVPISRHLVAAMAGWGVREGRVVERHARTLVDLRTHEAWEAAEVRPEVWRGYGGRASYHHAFRRGHATGLRAAGVSRDAVEYLQGRDLGVVGRYVTADGLQLAEAVDNIPEIGAVLRALARNARKDTSGG